MTQAHLLNLNLFIQLILFVLTALLIIAVSTYTTLFISVLFMISAAVYLLYNGNGLFSIILLVSEIHVFYLILCLTLTWSRHDTILITGSHGSKLLNNSMFITFCASLVIYVLGLLIGNKIYLLSTDNYVYVLLLDSQVMTISLSESLGKGAILQLSRCYLVTMSLEFFILNILMFIAVLTLFNIKSTASDYLTTTNIRNVCKALELYKSATHMMRQQNQTVQLKSSYSLRCASVSSKIWSLSK